MTTTDGSPTTSQEMTSRAVTGEVVAMSRFQRLVRFVCVGGFGFVFSTAVLAVLVGQGLPNFVASLLATEAAIILNYTGHEMFTFGTRQLTWRRLATYNASAALGLLITAVAFDAISRGSDLPLVVRNLIAVGCGTASNFLISSRLVWGTSAGAVTTDDDTTLSDRALADGAVGSTPPVKPTPPGR